VEFAGRLLSINNYYYRRSGAEVVYFSHNALFGDSGWDIVPFSMCHPENEPSAYADYFVDEIEYGRSYSPIGSLSRAGKVVYSFEAKRKINALVKSTRVDIAHCHCIYHHLSPSILGALENLRIPVVMTLHDLKMACPAYFMHRDSAPCDECRGGSFLPAIRHRCIKDSIALSSIVFAESTLHRLIGSYTNKVATYISPSRFYIDLLIDWGFKPDLFHHVPNFIDLTEVTENMQAGSRFGYVGRLSKEKGVSLLIEAAALTKMPLAIAGDGPELNYLEKLAQELRADVEFVGSLDREGVLAFMKKCRATVIPSIWYENCPMTVLESYAACTPVIGAAIGGVPEMIQPNVTGVLFEAGNLEALAGQLEAIAAMSAASIVAMGKNGRNYAEACYSPEKYFEAVSSVYESVRH